MHWASLGLFSGTPWSASGTNSPTLLPSYQLLELPLLHQSCAGCLGYPVCLRDS